VQIVVCQKKIKGKEVKLLANKSLIYFSLIPINDGLHLLSSPIIDVFTCHLLVADTYLIVNHNL